MPQANSKVQLTNRDADLGGDRARSWWRTLPTMFTAAAGLISAITGLIVAIKQLRPASRGASATSTGSAAVSPPATPASDRRSAIFRLRTGPNTSAPSNFFDDVVNGGTTDTGEVDFTFATSAGTAALLVGDDPTYAIALPPRLTGGSS